MTKINKLGKSTFVIAILSFLLVAVLAFGGTYAYFSAQTNTASGTVSLGKLSVTDVAGTATSSGNITLGSIAQPGQTLINNKTLTTTVKGNINYYIRAKFDVEVIPSGTHKAETENNCNDYVADPMEVLTVTPDDDTWKQEGDYFYKLAPTLATVEGVEETFTITSIEVADWLGNYNNTADGCTYWHDAVINVTISFEVMQADYLNDGTTAGKPFENVAAAAAAWTTALTTKQPEG